MSVSPDTTYTGAGIILTRIMDGRIQLLLLRGVSAGIWSFPKGHAEACDGGQPLRTAVRETREETGLVCGADYQIVGDRMRYGKNRYWLGVLLPGAREPIIEPREHTAAQWFDKDAVTTLTPVNRDIRIWIQKSQREGRFTQTLLSYFQRSAAPSSIPPICSTAEACSAS